MVGYIDTSLKSCLKVITAESKLRFLGLLVDLAYQFPEVFEDNTSVVQLVLLQAKYKALCNLVASTSDALKQQVIDMREIEFNTWYIKGLSCFQLLRNNQKKFPEKSKDLVSRLSLAHPLIGADRMSCI